MGSREQNFYNALARRMGFDDAAQRIQDLYLDRRPREAAAAVPVDFIDATSLVGPPERIRDRLQAYAAAGVTTLSVMPSARDLDAKLGVLRMLAAAVDRAGVAS
jgi:alkanesulfonate monooxygenase SsuD/methylene tetrahydromethanopterin reductase-like flavin-dependent oxidoreductase (luciferase family)